MYKPNKKHLQPLLISHVNDLPEKHRRRLEASWAGVFYRDYFCRLKEDPFGVLYADVPSRPNIPVNVLVGLETLKAGFGWSDEELYDHFIFDVQVRYALGYQDLKGGDFELRTLYNFRRRIGDYMQATGINLIEKAFEQVTDEQLEAFQLKTGKLRMDSTQIASHIRQMSRLQLLVEVLQRASRMLSEADQSRYKEEFKPYRQGSAGQYVYRIKGQEVTEHLQPIGELMARLVEELRADYGQEAAYRMLERVFQEHFTSDDGDEPRPRQGKELSAGSLQSPDDWEASYRRKNNAGHRGYVANLTETCDPENAFQLINKVQVEPNQVDDAAMLAQALPDLEARTDVEEVHTDGAYGSPEVDKALRKAKVAQIQTAIRGRKPAAEKLALEDFDWEIDDEGRPQAASCPGGQPAAVQPGRQAQRYLAYFDGALCRHCPYVEGCPTEPLRRAPRHVLRFSQPGLDLARRRKRSAELRVSGENLRAAVESTVRSVKHPFRHGKLPVRGGPRMSMLVIASAAMTNIRRMHGYQERLREERRKARAAAERLEEAIKNPLVSFATLLQRRLRRNYGFLTTRLWLPA